MINLTREEAQHVLDELLHLSDGLDAQKAIETLRAKLSEPEPEPVAWRKLWEGETEYTYYWSCRYKGSEPLYRVPPQREWVGLTIDELNMIGDRMNTWNSVSLTDVYYAIEAKLKAKNV